MQNYSRITANEKTTLGLIQLSPAASVDPVGARDQIHRTLGFDDPNSVAPVEILTRQQVVNREVAHWVFNTPIGFIFIAGVVIAMFVGAIVVYIVLSSDINKQIGEYATLKAMGYRNSYLSRVVLEQALILGVISYLVAFAISCVLYQVVGQAANLPITMTVFSASAGVLCDDCDVLPVGIHRDAKTKEGGSSGSVLVMHLILAAKLAWANTTNNWQRLFVRCSGVTFAVVLMFMQTGFRNALFDSNVRMMEEKITTDIVLRIRSRFMMSSGQQLPLQKVILARSCKGVSTAEPIYIEKQRFRISASRIFRREKIRVIALDPSSPSFAKLNLSDLTKQLSEPGTAAVDIKSKPMFNLPRTEKELAVNDEGELAGQDIHLVGPF